MYYNPLHCKEFIKHLSSLDIDSMCFFFPKAISTKHEHESWPAVSENCCWFANDIIVYTCHLRLSRYWKLFQVEFSPTQRFVTDVESTNINRQIKSF